jgi:hypothetical protein
MLPPNPYAFPVPFARNPQTGQFEAANHFDMAGMELRDYFAGQALIGVINQSTIAEVARMIMTIAAANGVTEHDVIGRAAYRYADAMLTAREKTPEAPDAVS